MDTHGVSRRGFLQAAGAASLAASMGAARAADASPGRWLLETDRKIRVGIVGGGFGAQFQWHLDPNCTVAAVSDLRPDRRQYLQEVYACDTAYESLERLILDDSIDAVAVFTGAPDHARHCVAVMDSGKHCLCAVPVAMSLDDCRAVIDAKERNKVRYMMAETSHYRAPAMFLRELYAQGLFGEVRYSEVEYYHPMPPGSEERKRLWYFEGKPTWRHGLPLMQYPTHCTDFVVGVTGERLVEVSCHGIRADDDAEMRGNQYGNPFHTEIALFRTDRGNLCRCARSRALKSSGERAQWFGERTSLHMASDAGQPFIFRQEGKKAVTEHPDYFDRLPEPMQIQTGHGNSHTFITREFICALLEDREPEVDVYTAVAETAPGIVAHQSSLRGGELLKVPSFDPKV